MLRLPRVLPRKLKAAVLLIRAMATSKKPDVVANEPIKEKAKPGLAFHPILESGVDVAPVTRGELKQILTHFADQLR